MQSLLLCALLAVPTPKQPANITAIVQSQFAQYDPTYPKWSAAGLKELNNTRFKLNALQQQGYPKFCSEQRYAEATTALLYYANSSAFSTACTLLLDSLKGPVNDSQSWALSESPNGTHLEFCRSFSFTCKLGRCC